RGGHGGPGADYRRADRRIADRHHAFHCRLRRARTGSGGAVHHHGAGADHPAAWLVHRRPSPEDLMKVVVLSLVAALATLFLGYTYSWTITPIVIGLTYAIAALGVSVMARAGQISFGHAMYSCISAYTVAFLARAMPGTDALVLILAGVVASFLAAVVVGLFVVRYRGIFF